MKKGIVGQALSSIAFYLTKREKWYSFFIFILLLISSVLDVFGLASIVPIIMAASRPDEISTSKYLGGIYKFLNFQDEKLFLLTLILFVFLFFLLKNTLTTWVNYKQVKFTAAAALKIITRQYHKYINLPYWYFNNEGSAKLINNIMDVPFLYKTGIIRSLFILLSEFTIVIVFVTGILLYQPVLFLLLLLILFPAALLVYKILKEKSEQIGSEINHLRPASYSILSNTFNGFVEIKLHNKVDVFSKKFIDNQKRVEDLEARAYLISLIPIKVIEMVAILSVVSIYIYTLFLQDNSESIIIIVGLFAAAAYRLMPSINRILSSLIALKQASVTIDQLRQFRKYESGEGAVGSINKLAFKDQITFKNISFAFPGESISALKDINLSIKKGDKVGLIGASGSGKTTLMNILLCLYEEYSGEILVDGLPLTAKNKEAWLKLVGYVKQDTFLMEGSIKDNITLLDPEVNMENLQKALEKASLKEFIAKLPHGLDTLIGERGFRLSGGQKQRIGIARALYKNAQVLILDEATSALDPQTEREVSEAITNLADTDITIFIIAHRVTTLKSVDRILEMKSGQLFSEHTYGEIIEKVI